MTTLEATLRARWNPKWSEAAHNRFDHALNLARDIPEKRAEFGKRGDLTDKGVQAAVRAHYGRYAVEALRNAQAEIARETVAIKAEREALARPAFDRADVFGELQRQELRTWLRGLDVKERLEAVLTSGNVEYMAAALGGPGSLSGLTPELVQKVREAYVTATAAGKVITLDEREEANALLRVAADVAVSTLREDSGLEGPAFDAWFANPAAEQILPPA